MIHVGNICVPDRSTQEDLDMDYGFALVYGEHVLVAGYRFNALGPCWFGACYEFLSDDHSCEGEVGLRAVSGLDFEDNGHAIAWAMAQ